MRYLGLIPEMPVAPCPFVFYLIFTPVCMLFESNTCASLPHHATYMLENLRLSVVPKNTTRRILPSTGNEAATLRLLTRCSKQLDDFIINLGLFFYEHFFTTITKERYRNGCFYKMGPLVMLNRAVLRTIKSHACINLA